MTMVKNGESKKLIGEFESKVVSGNRIALPVQLRKPLGTKCVIARGYEESLIIVPHDKWNDLVKPLETSSFFDRNIRDTLRFIVGSSFEVEFDKQGRFVVPQSLRSYSHIEFGSGVDEVVFIGLINWVEVWSKKLWQERVTFLEQNADAIAQELNTLQK